MNIYARFIHKVKKTPTCWIWLASVTNSGYGRFSIGKKTKLAHRFIYEHEIASIPIGMTIDHLCRNKLCVNPSHLEVVTARENVLRGNTIVRKNYEKTHCIRGHELIGKNLANGYRSKRVCVECRKLFQKKARSTDNYKIRHATYERMRRKKIRDSI